MNITKKCFKCNVVKPIIQFYSHPATADKHLNKCKLCTKKDVRSHRRDPRYRNKVLAYDRERNKDPKRIRARSIRGKRSRKLFPGKARSRNALNNAIRSRKIVRKPCEICGDRNSEGHHIDYRKKLQVKWLCSQHHHDEHFKTYDKKFLNF